MVTPQTWKERSTTMLKVVQETETARDKCPPNIGNEGHFQEQFPRFPRYPVRVQPRAVAVAPGGWSLSMERRCFDFVVSLLVLIATFIPGLLVYLLIWATSKGPSVVRQNRVRVGGSASTVSQIVSML